jgi:N-acetylneuraminate lyase
MPSIQEFRLIAAPHTPFHPDGSLRPEVIDRQAEHLVAQGVKAVFVGGTTGESASLTFEERRQIAERWCGVARGSGIQVIVHAGSNCLHEAVALAAHAARSGAAGVAAVAPSYFKPASVELLVDCCAQVAAAAPELPFYYYEIPSLTGLNLPMAEFLERAADRIPNLAGLKYSHTDLVTFQRCREASGGRFEVFWGTDEVLLGALALGARAAVGSTYNFAAPIYHSLLAAFAAGDWKRARRDQLRSVTLVGILDRRSFMASAKGLMRMLGVDVGPARLPHRNLTPAEQAELRRELETVGFFDWIRE